MNLLRRFCISHRLSLLITLAFLGITVTTFIALVQARSGLMEEKTAQTRKLVETVHSVLSGYHQRAQAGEMDAAGAQRAALKTVEGIRFDGGNYFWINDMQAEMVMHPIKPALNGKNLATFEDPSGKRLFSEFVATVKRDGEGTVPYLWPKPGHEEPVAKVSYVKGFEPWGWIVGSGIYVDDVDALFWRNTVSLGAVSMVVLALLLGMHLLIARSINRPLRATIGALHEIAGGDGDLSRRLDTTGGDEVSKLAAAFNAFVDNIQHVVQKVERVSGELAGAADALTSVTSEGRGRMQQQQAETQQVATAVTQMASTVQEIARSAEGAAQSASDANREARAGKSTMDHTTQEVAKLAAEVSEATRVIDQLQTESDNIGSVLDVIRGIAEQTNLLALNAAIEAARAGEQGRGFAVVADEVRTLASRTQASTQEIQQMIERLQVGSQQAVSVMKRGSATATATVDTANESAGSLANIVQSVDEISDMNTRIAGAAEEQSTVAQEIDQSISRIAELTGAAADAGDSVGEASANLSRLGQELRAMITTFKVG